MLNWDWAKLHTATFHLSTCSVINMLSILCHFVFCPSCADLSKLSRCRSSKVTNSIIHSNVSAFDSDWSIIWIKVGSFDAYRGHGLKQSIHHRSRPKGIKDDDIHLMNPFVINSIPISIFTALPYIASLPLTPVWHSLDLRISQRCIIK